MRSIEDQLRNLIESAASPVSAEEGRRLAMNSHAGRLRERVVRRYRLVIGLAVLATLIVGSAAVVWIGNDDDSGRRVQSAAQPTSIPGEFVAVTSDGRLVVLAATDGHVIRVLATDAIAHGKNADGSTSLAVTPDGQTVYFMRQQAGCAACVEIASVPTAVAPITPMAQGGRFPAVSPDGHWLAYTGVPNQSDAGRDILLRDLTIARSPDSAEYDRRWGSTSPLSVGITSLAWSPDSQHLAFVQNDTPDGKLVRTLDINTPQTTPLDGLPPIRINGADGMSFAGYRGKTGDLLAVADSGRGGLSLDAERKSLRVVTVSPTSGKVTRVLFKLPGASQPVSDASGTNIIVKGTGGLYRWHQGDPRPIKIGQGIDAAAWVSDYPSDGPARQPALLALTATGPADCSSVTKPGDTTLLAVTVNGGHAVCVTQYGDATTSYLDGRRGGETTGLEPLGQGSWSFGGLGTAEGRFFVLANLLNTAGSLRLTFCDGRTLDLHPLNTDAPRFVAASFDDKYGQPSPQQLDTSGQPIGEAHQPLGSGHSNCTSTTSRAKTTK